VRCFYRAFIYPGPVWKGKTGNNRAREIDETFVNPKGIPGTLENHLSLD
jgi:hypothetical protein